MRKYHLRKQWLFQILNSSLNCGSMDQREKEKSFLFCRRTSANCPIRVFLRRLNSEKKKCTTRYAASVGHLCMEMSVNVDLKVLR